MNKLARIRAFVDFQSNIDTINVTRCTPLFDKLLINVKKEYKKFHENREPKINNLEIALNESRDQAGYLCNLDFIDAFTKMKGDHELPFSIKQEIKYDSVGATNGRISFPTQHLLRTSYFVSNAVSRETFHQIQRQHKIWWMKYGASPGKYSISDQKSEDFYKFVSIRSSVEDEQMEVEHLKLFSLKDCIKEKEIVNSFLARVPNRKKEVIPDVIESVVDLQIASLALLLDGVQLSGDYTALHRRSAPYQLALIVSSFSKDLTDLARYIELLIHITEPQIEILNESEAAVCNETDLHIRFQKLDAIGVPYAIVLDEKSLESGMLQLRNRNTTLSETIHLSDVTNYLIKIFTAK